MIVGDPREVKTAGLVDVENGAGKEDFHEND
jgi:hypothetical protein